MLFEDVETCGRHGMIVLIQYAIDDGEIQMFSPWTSPVCETLELIEMFVTHPEGVCGFNLAFDWFHLCKLYTTFKLFERDFGSLAYPEDHIDEIAILEKEARDGPCLKPIAAIDLMLHARKGPYQSLMNRDDIRIRRVPTQLAPHLAIELGKRIPLKDIYFARMKNGRPERWQVYDSKKSDGEPDPEFKDIVCKFAPSSALKALAVDALGIPESEILKYGSIECKQYPEEVGYAPFALAVGTPDCWNGAWPVQIGHHIRHWAYNELARKYAKNDVVFTRGLYYKFGKPASNDDDSVLSILVATVRWRGFRVDLDGLRQLRQEALVTSKSTVTAPAKVKIYLEQVMNDEEKILLDDGTGKEILLEIADWRDDDDKVHPAAIRAKEVLACRKAIKEIELYDKIILAGRFHASFTVIGTKSSRMSGADGLNPQGINHSNKVRSKFKFAWDGQTLSGGDFSSFEVSLAAAVYKDPLLDEDLKLGKKMAGIFAEFFFPEMTYEDVLESEGSDDDFYDRSKRGMYAYFYGGNESTFKNRIQIDIEVGQKAIAELEKRYKGIGKARKRISDMFCAMRQPDGLGSKVVWNEPQDSIASPLGFRRYFTLENQICKVLFALANKPPEEWKQFRFKVTRRDRQQTAQGATQSALYGAAFQLQAANFRAAANHEIQCFGSQITKAIQVTVWGFQPAGVNEWCVMPMNNHDELACPHKPELGNAIEVAVQTKIQEFRSMVPLLKMKWMQNLNSWKGKE